MIVGADPTREQQRIVFLHGLMGRGKNFTTIAGALAPDAQSLLVDLPNHGASDWTDALDYEAMADAVAKHIRASFAPDGQVDVVGHSMGGKVAMVLALRHPEIVRRLVIIDIAPTSLPTATSEFPHLLGSLAGVDLGALTKRSDAHDVLREAIPNNTVRGFLLQNLRHGEQGFEWEPNIRMLLTQLDAVLSFPETGSAQFDGPVLWIGGERSDYIQDTDEPRMRELFPRTRRLTVKGVGHWVHSQAPQVTIEALRAFLLT